MRRSDKTRRLMGFKKSPKGRTELVEGEEEDWRRRGRVRVFSTGFSSIVIEYRSGVREVDSDFSEVPI